jgi:hypothetical protein
MKKREKGGGVHKFCDDNSILTILQLSILILFVHKHKNGGYGGTN